jgi:predicted phosphate transport protein (TIGR00153 family)
MLIFKKEKEVRKLILDHISVSYDCLSEARSMTEAYVAGDKDSVAEKAIRVKSLEREADILKRQAREVLHQGAFLPHIRSDLHNLVELVDGIVGIGEEVAKFLSNQSPQIPEEFEADLLAIFGLCVSCFNELRKALRDYVIPKGEIESLHIHVEKVSALESEIDDRQALLTKKVFASEIDLAAKMHFAQLLRVIASISDAAEELSDELESTVMRSVV